MLGMAAYVGIEKDKPFKPDAHTVQILERAAKDAQEYLIRISNGVTFVPDERHPGWMRFNLHKEDIAKGRLYVYENADGMIAYQRRAAIDYYAYVMPAVLGSGTMYNPAFVDAEDRAINRPRITGSGCRKTFLPGISGPCSPMTPTHAPSSQTI